MEQPRKAHIPWLCWCAYSCAYFCRVNLSVSLPYLQAEFGYDKGTLGLIASAFFWMYALGQLINGVLGDRYHPRYFVATGLLGAGVANLLFPFARSLPALLLLWALNGYLQSMLWGPIVRTITIYTPEEKRHGAMLVLSTSMIAGYLVSYAVVGRVAASFGWRLAFQLPGALMILMAGVWLLGLKGFPTVAAQAPAAPAGAPPPPRAEGVLAFLLRTRLWVVALVCIMQGLIREGLTLWGPTFFAESQALGIAGALQVMTLLPFLNFLGLFLGAGLNKKLGMHERRTMLLLFILASLLTTLLFFSLDSSLVRTVATFGALSATVFSINNMIMAFVPLNFYGEGRVSSAAGFLDCAAYIGAAVAGPLLGALADASGWRGVTACWIAASLLGLVLTLFSRDYKKARKIL